MSDPELVDVWLTFFASLTWPLVLLTAIILFRAEVSSLLSRIRSGEFAGAKLSLSEAAQTIRTKAEKLASETDPGQRGRLAQEIQQAAASLGAVSNEWFRYDMRFRGMPEQ